jgi:hypothetical protein
MIDTVAVTVAVTVVTVATVAVAIVTTATTTTLHSRATITAQTVLLATPVVTPLPVLLTYGC